MLPITKSTKHFPGILLGLNIFALLAVPIVVHRQCTGLPVSVRTPILAGCPVSSQVKALLLCHLNQELLRSTWFRHLVSIIIKRKEKEKRQMGYLKLKIVK